METYKIEVYCSNCEHAFTAEVPKARTVNNYLALTDCTECGCRTLERKQALPSLPFVPWDAGHYQRS